jgi:urease accessory protein UreF
MQNNSLVTLAALHLASPALPIGGFAYSQGLEQAIEDRLVHDAQTAQIWIHDILMFSLAKQELVLWIGAHDAVSADDIQALDRINTEILSLRETREFRLESTQMGQSLAKLFPQWPEAQHFIQQLKAYPKTIALTYTAAFHKLSLGLGREPSRGGRQADSSWPECGPGNPARTKEVYPRGHRDRLQHARRRTGLRCNWACHLVSAP